MNEGKEGRTFVQLLGYMRAYSMNEGKEGRTFVQLLGYMRAYRQTEGVVRAHAKSKVPSIPDYRYNPKTYQQT